MKAITHAVLAVTLFLSLAGPLRAADIDGRWKAEFEVQDSQMKYVYELKADGDKLTGKAYRDRDGEKATNNIQNGTIKGDQITFVETVQADGQELRIEYTGKVSGDEIKFTRKVGDFGSNDIVAKREKDGSIAGKWQSEFDSQVGHQKYLYEFALDGDKLTGKATRELEGEKTTTDIKGKVTGSDVSFTEPLNVQDQEITIEYSGKISGDEIKLTRKVGDFATTEITANRAKDAGVK